MLQTILQSLNVGLLSTRANENQHNQEVKVIVNVGKIIKTLLKTKKSKNLAKFDNSTKSKNLTKSKKLDKAKKLELVKNKIFEMDFCTFEAKIVFLHL